jgi:TonB-dependent receptor
MRNSLGLIGTAIWSLRAHKGCHLGRRVFFVIQMVAILILMTQSLMAVGKIKGKVYDKDTKDPLPAATVIIKGTSVGAIADLNGSYTIINAPTGKQTIMVSYVGYVSKSVVVTVTEDGTVMQNFALQGAGIQGQEIVVTGQAQGQMQAINQQLSSNKIVSVVSEEKIQQLPDFNAAAAISRLPGITTLSSSGEANKIVIRGLDPKYNQITIGGISLASTGSTQIGVTSQDITGSAQRISNDRSVDLSMMSPYMIKTIAVYKSLTPDMNANSIGGTVNMELREAPSELHTDLLYQSGYTQKSGKYGNYRAVASGSGRFFDDLLGLYVLGNIEKYDRDADNMNAGYEITSDKVGDNGYLPVRVTNVQLNRHFETRNRYGVNMILDYNLPSGSIKLVNMFSRLNSDYKDYKTILNYSSQTQDLFFRYQEGDNNVDLASNSLDFTYDLGFMTVDLKAANNYSRNNLPSSPQAEFYQTRGVGTSTPNTIPDDLTHLIQYGGTATTYLNTLTLFNSDYKENGQTGKGDFKIPLNLGSILTGYFKFGGEFKYTTHNNAQSTPYATIGGTSTIQHAITDGLLAKYPYLVFSSSNNRFPATSFTSNNGDLLKSFLDDRFGGMIWAPDGSLMTGMIDYISGNSNFSSYNASSTDPGGWYNGYYQRLPNTYQYLERYFGGYLMSEMNYGDLMMVGGARYEKENSIYDAYVLMDGRDEKSQKFFKVTTFPQDEFWLPMVQAKYNVADWVDVRASYTQTLARPDYHQLSPSYTISYGQGTVRSGNPNLKTAHAYNNDVILTFHNNELGLFSVSGFYKEIKNFAYSTQYALFDTAPEGIFTTNDFNIGGTKPVKGATLYTYMNTPYMAYVRGAELDLQTRFWYLPDPFNGIILSFNYTRISSSAIYPWRNARTTIIGPRQTITTVFDSTRTGRLINQPNNIVNASIGYDYNDFSARLSFLFQGNAVSYVGNFTEQDGFTRDYFRMDASVRQKLPWYGIEIFLDLANINGANNTSAQQSIGGFTNEQNYGLTANLGIRCRLSNK